MNAEVHLQLHREHPDPDGRFDQAAEFEVVRPFGETDLEAVAAWLSGSCCLG